MRQACLFWPPYRFACAADGRAFKSERVQVEIDAGSDGANLGGEIMATEYNDTARYVLDGVRFSCQGNSYKGQGFMEWNPTTGFRIDALLGRVQKLIRRCPGKEGVIPVRQVRVPEQVEFPHLLVGDRNFGWVMLGV